MLHAFIDTNVYLTFFGFTADDLEELRKLRAAISNGDLRLWTTEQVRNEFRRNRGSLGDAINWECLLSECPGGEDLFFVTEDADYVSKMDRDRIATFLEREWTEAKDGEVHLYRRISDFLRDKFPDIELASEFEKELRVASLVSSPSFEETHRRISRLSGYTEFSDQQVRDLFEAALVNSQISWIAHDSDVQAFFQDLVASHRDLFDADELEHFHRLFDPDHEDSDGANDDDIPF